MHRSRLLVLASSIALGALGFAASYWFAPPLGADHSCPTGSPPSACHYPGGQTSWSVWLTLVGLAAGLCVGLIARGLLRRRAR